MTANTRNKTQVEVDQNLPTIRTIREFESTPERVFRAWTDADLFAQWTGPDGYTTQVDVWDARTGGSYEYLTLKDGDEVAAFYGSFHEVRPAERLVQTFTYRGYPDSTCLETITFEPVGEHRTRVTSLTVLYTLEERDGLVASGMEQGIVEGYRKLDTLLANF